MVLGDSFFLEYLAYLSKILVAQDIIRRQEFNLRVTVIVNNVSYLFAYVFWRSIHELFIVFFAEFLLAYWSEKYKIIAIKFFVVYELRFPIICYESGLCLRIDSFWSIIANKLKNFINEHPYFLSFLFQGTEKHFFFTLLIFLALDTNDNIFMVEH